MATCSLTVRARAAASPRWATLSLMPAIDSALSPTATWTLRFGSRRQWLPRIGRAGHGHVAAHVGALIERLAGDVLQLLADVAAEQIAERAADIAGLIGNLPGHAQRAVELR